VYTWINTYREGNNFPLGDDLNGAAQALVRLQDTYQLDMTSLADGIVKPSQSSSKDSSWSSSMTDVSGKIAKPLKLFFSVSYLCSEQRYITNYSFTFHSWPQQKIILFNTIRIVWIRMVRILLNRLLKGSHKLYNCNAVLRSLISHAI
jgi:hypothetical protein